tara:strand:- start:409 stop:720 length:312 start_codon:yes stop_codon:yes gene_type:complete
MKIELRLEKVSKDTIYDVEFAHINLTFDMEDVTSGYAKKEWKLKSTGFRGVVGFIVKGEHNIYTLQWLMDVFKNNSSLEKSIYKFADDMIKADALLNTAREVA